MAKSVHDDRMTADTEFVAKIRSLNVARASRRSLTKVTTDVHDHHTVEVTERWHDRQDVTVMPQTAHIKPKGNVHGA